MRLIERRRPLDGRLILIVEDEILIAFDLEATLQEYGAATLTKRTVAEALSAVESSDICAAIVDQALGDGDSSELCRRLTERGVPFVTYCGNPHLVGPCSSAARLEKPANPKAILAAFQKLLDGENNGASRPPAVDPSAQ